MIFKPSCWCRPVQWLDTVFTQPLAPEGPGLWAGVLSSGQCVLDTPGAEPAAVRAGSLVLAAGSFRLVPVQPCRMAAVCLQGAAADAFAAKLPGPMFADGLACPRAAELLARLQAAREAPLADQCALGFSLLCQLSEADRAAPALPPLVAEALVQIRENYAGLYGVEELSEALGVSKSHLVRSFSAAMGVSPGQYLTQVRVEAAKHLLMHREYPLEVVAGLCGFSGANYLCRVFKKVTGQTPAAWRAKNSSAAPAGALPLEQELYI